MIVKEYPTHESPTRSQFKRTFNDIRSDKGIKAHVLPSKVNNDTIWWPKRRRDNVIHFYTISSKELVNANSLYGILYGRIICKFYF